MARKRRPTPLQLAKQLRLRVSPVRDSRGQAVRGDWHIRCRNKSAILYPYDIRTWCADMLSTYHHNLLIRKFPGQMMCFAQPAEITGGGRGDEHTLHFDSELLGEVAGALKAYRRRRASEAQRKAARATMLRLHREGRVNRGLVSS